jgi:hypothetical protein
MEPYQKVAVWWVLALIPVAVVTLGMSGLLSAVMSPDDATTLAWALFGVASSVLLFRYVNILISERMPPADSGDG